MSACKLYVTICVSVAIQGIGNGGILSLSDIIIADLVPLSERGMFQGILAVSWAVASAIGPPIGGLVSHHWRWLFCNYTSACGTVLDDTDTLSCRYQYPCISLRYILRFMFLDHENSGVFVPK